MYQRFHKEYEKEFFMKINVTIIPTNLVTNSLLSFVCPFVETKNNNQISASWWSGNEKYFCLLLIASRALLQRYAEFNRLLKTIFLQVIPARIIVPCSKPFKKPRYTEKFMVYFGLGKKVSKHLGTHFGWDSSTFFSL